MIGTIGAIVVSYLLGSIPLGLLLAKVFKGVDIRQVGSGKIGAANVLRTLGWKASVAVFIFDAGKGVAAVFIARALADPSYAEALSAMAAVAGHNWSIFIGFKGGRGVNASLGGVFAMAPVVGAICLAAGLAVMVASRYVSIGSMSGAVVAFIVSLGLAAAGQQAWAHTAYIGVAAALIVFQHRDNIVRLVRGQERRLGQPAEVGQPKGAKPQAG